MNKPSTIKKFTDIGAIAGEKKALDLFHAAAERCRHTARSSRLRG